MTQFDYLHVRRLVDALAAAFDGAVRPGDRVLDVYCGSRPYDDLLPAGTQLVGLDVPGNPYGVADVVSDVFLPFEDASFDVVLCIQAFDYVADTPHAVSELRRVLRPGGRLVLTVPLVWEYDRTTPAHRWSGPDLATAFAGWDDVAVSECGGRAVAWATLTGSFGSVLAQRLGGRPLGRLVGPAVAGLYVALNGAGAVLDAVERRAAHGPNVLPMNLVLTARAPAA